MSLSCDLERLYRMDDATAWTRADEERMAAWAHDTVTPPETDRDLGQLAGWAESITERRTS